MLPLKVEMLKKRPPIIKRIKRVVSHRLIDLRARNMARQILARATLAWGQKPVIVFNASTRLEAMSLNAGFSLVTAWALRMAGVPVIHFVCQKGLRPCVLGTQRTKPEALPPCRACMAQSKVFFPEETTVAMAYCRDEALERATRSLALASLMDFSYRGLALGELVLPSLRWILRRHNLQDDESTRYLFRQYILSAWSLAQQVEKLLEKYEPQAVVVFNGMFYPEATVRWLAQRRGVRVISHEVALRPLTAFFTAGEATAYPIDVPDDFELNGEREARLTAYLEQRFQGRFSMAGIHFWRDIHQLGASYWERATSFKQVVPVFTNVVFDTSQSHANQVFPDMFAWLDRVLGVIRRHPETLFVIRAHPDEARPGKESNESVAMWAERNRINELENVLFINSEEYLSSYELIQRSKFVIVYNSTIGLEASIMGAAVLCGGRARFTQLPTVIFPASPEAFEKEMETMLTAETIRVPEAYQRNARRFLYYQLYKMALSFKPFLKEDPCWQGYVLLKPFSWRALLPENNPVIGTLLRGILEGAPFVVDA